MVDISRFFTFQNLDEQYVFGAENDRDSAVGRTQLRSYGDFMLSVRTIFNTGFRKKIVTKTFPTGERATDFFLTAARHLYSMKIPVKNPILTSIHMVRGFLAHSGSCVFRYL